MADRDTIFRLLMQHEGEFRAFVRSMLRDRGLCHDVFQEVALTLWEQASRYDASRPFGPWARGIAANKVIERRGLRATHSTPVSGSRRLSRAGDASGHSRLPQVSESLASEGRSPRSR